ncbi:DUF5304 family protein [Streptomyces sp. DH37]|uniref:DUF5304 family protein n=1 Tax=Streptomyces sp. DH37 TaxID=3040122 RepID=UPI002441820E|nr:DUF5304 family protein [Streptomyces sp. DH37]MDG9700885.1 DUF5304 family protein [Streptomyces sp. DH37]
MSDATERPADAGPDADPDAWATACEEDLAAERERRRERYGTPPGSAAEELLRLADAITGKLAELGVPLTGSAARQFAEFADRARAVVEPVVERNPKVFDHLAAAGGELLAAYRAAVTDQERRWTRDGTDGGRTEDAGKRAEEDTGRSAGKSAGASTAGSAGEDAAGDRGAPADRDGSRGRDGDGQGGDGEDDGPTGSQRIELD